MGVYNGTCKNKNEATNSNGRILNDYSSGEILLGTDYNYDCKSSKCPTGMCCDIENQICKYVNPEVNMYSMCQVSSYERSGENSEKFVTNGFKCGKNLNNPSFDYGKCPPGSCCSKDGSCGNTWYYCTNSQLEYNGDNSPVIHDIKCGINNGNNVCPNDKCCLAKGICVDSSNIDYNPYASENLIIGEFSGNECVSRKPWQYFTCGPGIGKCPPGHCCQNGSCVKNEVNKYSYLSCWNPEWPYSNID